MMIGVDKVILDGRPSLFALGKVKVVLEVNHVRGTTSNFVSCSDRLKRLMRGGGERTVTSM